MKNALAVLPNKCMQRFLETTNAFSRADITALVVRHLWKTSRGLWSFCKPLTT